MAKPKIMIATPAYGEIFYTPYVSSMFKLTRLFQKNGWDFAFNSISYSEISESRNYLLTYWFDKTDASHILFVDADMGFPPQLISDMLALEKPLVGAVYLGATAYLDATPFLAPLRYDLSACAVIAVLYDLIPMRYPRDYFPTFAPGALEIWKNGSVRAATSSPVRVPYTPGSSSAFETSIDVMCACA